MHDDPVAAARRLVEDRFPAARWAMLTGSVLTAARTPGSDLDILVFHDEGDGLPFREWRRWEGFNVDLFAYDQAGLDRYLANDLRDGRPALHRMLSGGQLLTGDDEQAARLRSHCADVLAAGPRPLTVDQLNMTRYGLADLSDDLVHATDPVEVAATAAVLWQAVADAACATASPPHWRGTGKWRARELLAWNPAYAGRWLDARHDPRTLLAMAAELITSTGGPLVEGFRVAGER
ncbi:nucleotidyltransferase domain-containing protein [Catellatospora methionotrophica]|uniref:nucleotidyltransferase domain-containing protein n=1 Tax=Catellatospora methionotrophica TaxID=121620 RepID=UPI00194549E1|nr:nucleotidyltransferase domain-containing protein [Catellatospora methionotrophica]